jgi:RNA polymerase sigma factor (sigma-70 family)
MSTESSSDDVLISELVRSAQRGDAGAVEFVARRACRLALRTASAVLSGPVSAADVSQDVAVEVLRSLDRLRDPLAFDAWVHRITVRQALRAARLEKRSVPTETWPTRDPGPLEGEVDLVATVAARSAVRVAVAGLPARQRLALALRYVHDLSDVEIAAALGCRPGTVPALLSRARAALRVHPGLAEFAPTTAGEQR